jgi:hypothetical protein
MVYTQYLHKYIQSANITCDEPIKKAYHQEINRILLIYLPIPTYLPTKWLD